MRTNGTSLADLKLSLGELEIDYNIDKSPDILIEPFKEILENSIDITCDVDQYAKVYICGYAAHTVCKKIRCDLCKSFVRKAKGEFLPNNEYFNELQRGGLSIPQENLEYIFQNMCSIFETIINSSKCSTFLTSENQKDILVILTHHSVQEYDWFSDFNYVCQCGQNLIVVFDMLCSIFSNILLNNYVKNTNSRKLEASKRKTDTDDKDRHKIRKLKSLQK